MEFLILSAGLTEDPEHTRPFQMSKASGCAETLEFWGFFVWLSGWFASKLAEKTVEIKNPKPVPSSFGGCRLLTDIAGCFGEACSCECSKG
eukprot:1141918-Pelagomonas_calceolata.AAC.2